MGVIFFGIFAVGIGSTAIFSFGLPFVDDNNEKNNSPLALAVASCGRTIGPALGYFIGSSTLKYYVYPREKPEGQIMID